MAKKVVYLLFGCDEALIGDVSGCETIFIPFGEMCLCFSGRFLEEGEPTGY
jgi:hypothetical protein